MNNGNRTTYFVSDERMLLHKNEWDEHHIETPERLASILKMLRAEGVLEKCTILDSKYATLDDILLVHSQHLIDEFRSTQFMDLLKLEEFSATKEDVYVNQHSYESALLAAGSSLHLLETVLANPGSNGFAAVRPPGHHASYDDPCGFCIFNNIALCAKKARKSGLERVLILDWDVHAAQGTQYCIENDDGIKLISIHRYEHGNFWPELAESAVKQPYKNTINIPLNDIGYGDAEYAAIMNLFVLPIIVAWEPQLIVVSCGYDAAIGDPQGEMNVSPGGYAFMTGALASLNIPLVLFLEGGYFIHSVALGSLYTMNALIQRSQLDLNLDISKPDKKFMAFLEYIISTYAASYDVFSVWSSSLNYYRKKHKLSKPEMIGDEFKGNKILPIPYPTRGLYTPRTEAQTRAFDGLIAIQIARYKTPFPEKEKLYSNYDDISSIFNIANISIKVDSDAQFRVIFNYLLIPLSFIYEVIFTFNGEAQIMNNGLYRTVNCRISKTKVKTSTEFFEKITEILNAYEFIKEYLVV